MYDRVDGASQGIPLSSKCFAALRYSGRISGWHISIHQHQSCRQLYPTLQLSEPLIRVAYTLGNECVEACRERLPDGIVIPPGDVDIAARRF